jgi:hypothetical protein
MTTSICHISESRNPSGDPGRRADTDHYITDQRINNLTMYWYTGKSQTSEERIRVQNVLYDITKKK